MNDLSAQMCEQWMHQFEAEWRAGYPHAIIDGVRECRRFNQPLPKWLAQAIYAFVNAHMTPREKKLREDHYDHLERHGLVETSLGAQFNNRGPSRNNEVAIEDVAAFFVKLQRKGFRTKVPKEPTIKRSYHKIKRLQKS